MHCTNGYTYIVSFICDCLLVVRMISNFGGLTLKALLNSAVISLIRQVYVMVTDLTAFVLFRVCH